MIFCAGFDFVSTTPAWPEATCGDIMYMGNVRMDKFTPARKYDSILFVQPPIVIIVCFLMFVFVPEHKFYPVRSWPTLSLITEGEKNFTPSKTNRGWQDPLQPHKDIAQSWEHHWYGSISDRACTQPQIVLSIFISNVSEGWRNLRTWRTLIGLSAPSTSIRAK